MIKIKNIAMLACAALAGLSTACIDGNDWDADGSQAGIFRPTSFSASQTEKGATTVKFTFGSVPGATKYQIEASLDTIVSADIDPNNIVAEVAKSPATIDGFDVECKYYARVRAIGDMGTSAWVVLEKAFSTSAVQLISDVETSMNTAKAIWPAGSNATKITLEVGDEVIREIELTQADIAAGELKISGLEPMTFYTVKLWNGSVRVGVFTAKTQSAGPSGDYNKVWDPEKYTYVADLLDEVAAEAAADGNTEYSVTVVIPAEVHTRLASLADDGSETNLTIPDGMSVTFYGERANALDELEVNKSVGLNGTHKNIKFQNLTITGNGYIVNQSAECDVDSITFEDCKIANVPTAFFRTQGGSPVGNVNNLTLRNSVFTNIGKGYGFIHMDGAVIKNVDIDGCTFNGVCATGKCFFMMTKYVEPLESFKLKNSTFYNFCGGGQYFLDFKDKTNGPDVFELTNVIFGKTGDDVTNKNVRGTCDVADYTSGCVSTTDCFKVIKGVVTLDKSSADIFADPDNGDFTIKEGAGVENCGDPRWL